MAPLLPGDWGSGPDAVDKDDNEMGDQFTVWCTPEYGYTSTFRRRRSIDWTKRMSAQARLFAASPEMVEMLCALVESTDAIPLSHTTLVSTPTDEEPKWRWQ